MFVGVSAQPFLVPFGLIPFWLWILLGQADGNVRCAEFGPGEGGRLDKGGAATKKGEPTAPAAASIIYAWQDVGVGWGVLSSALLCFGKWKAAACMGFWGRPRWLIDSNVGLSCSWQGVHVRHRCTYKPLSLEAYWIIGFSISCVVLDCFHVCW